MSCYGCINAEGNNVFKNIRGIDMTLNNYFELPLHKHLPSIHSKLDTKELAVRRRWGPCPQETLIQRRRQKWNKWQHKQQCSGSCAKCSLRDRKNAGGWDVTCLESQGQFLSQWPSAEPWKFRKTEAEMKGGRRNLSMDENPEMARSFSGAQWG